MAKWNVTPGTAGNTMTSKLEYRDGIDGVEWEVKQDVGAILKEVKLDRELAGSKRASSMGWRKAFTVPDIVAIEILHKYGLDLHDSNFMADRDKMNKLKKIIKEEYPYLLIST